MWTKSPRLLMVRVKVPKGRKFSFPVPIWVIDEFLEALTDLAWVGEQVVSRVPLPRDQKAHQVLSRIKTISPSGIVTTMQSIIQDFSSHQGLDVVDVETGEVQVKISIK